MSAAGLDRESDTSPTRSEVAEYVHDVIGQLADMAQAAGLGRTADALVKVRAVVETEF